MQSLLDELLQLSRVGRVTAEHETFSFGIIVRETVNMFSIQLTEKHGEEETVFFVRDNGIGIDPQYHETIFGLFARLDQSIDGTGIGLALVKRIIETYNGRIWVESALGEGTTFYFTIGT